MYAALFPPLVWKLSTAFIPVVQSLFTRHVREVAATGNRAPRLNSATLVPFRNRSAATAVTRPSRISHPTPGSLVANAVPDQTYATLSSETSPGPVFTNVMRSAPHPAVHMALSSVAGVPASPSCSAAPARACMAMA